jgi:hypothetical protein
VGRAGREIDEERLVPRQRLLLADPLDGLVGHVDLAGPEEHRRIFLDAGAPARALVARYRDWVDVSWPFLDELAQAALDPAPAAASPMPVVIERLSERERACSDICRPC